MIKVAGSINTLSLAATETDFVPPDEQIKDDYIVLHKDEYQAILDRIAMLESRFRGLSDLQDKILDRLETPSTTREDEIRAVKLVEILESRKIISFAEARGLLRCDKVLLNRAIKALPKGLIGIKKSTTDKRARYLFLIPKIS